VQARTATKVIGALLVWGSVAIAGYIGGWTFQSDKAASHLTQEARALVGPGGPVSSPGANAATAEGNIIGILSGSGSGAEQNTGGVADPAGLLASVAQQAQSAAVTPPCATPNAQVNQVAGLLEVPTLSMQAPVVQGEDEGVLAEAVGHDVSSVWPGSDGTAVLAAHDVSYFAHISSLKPGDRIMYLDGCHEDIFVVTGSQVVPAGSTVVNTPTPYLVLDTCWPTDALWYTPNRFLVFAQEVQVINQPSAAATRAGELVRNETPLQVPVPPALAAQGLTLDDNAVLLGTMSVAGHPSTAFIESPLPLDVEESALTAYFGALHALSQGQTSWWKDIAPGVPVPQPNLDAHISNQDSNLLVTILGSGNQPAGAILSSTDYFAGGSAPGTYTLKATMVVRGNELVIGSWTMTPYGG
jgi:sortase A